MTQHLPECPSESIVCEGEYCYCDYAHFCCCDALRACEKRVIAAAGQRVEALAKEWEEQTLAVQLAIGIALAALRAREERALEGRPDSGISEKQAIANHSIYQNGYEQGRSDAAAAAVQRVGSLWGFTDAHGQMGKPGIRWVDLDLVIARIESKEISND